MHPKPYDLMLCPATPENARNSEGDIVELEDGRLLLAYSDFYGGSEDHAAARISGKLSEDVGRTWSDKFTLQENVARQNVMSATLMRLQSGEIILFYGHKNASSDLKFYVKKSTDEGESWDEAVCVTPREGYHVMNNDRAIQLTSGRLLAPVSYSSECWSEREHYRSVCFYSDDDGRTWEKGPGEVDLPKRGAMEPGLVELRDGSVTMILRSQLGRIYRSYSVDRGLTWTEPEPMDLTAPESPATIKRIPMTGDLLMIWNNTYEEGADHGGKRNPLTSAISRDEGKTWEHFRNVETDPRYTYAYTSVTFVGEEALMTYYAGEVHMGWSLKLKIIPGEWFYGG